MTTDDAKITCRTCQAVGATLSGRVIGSLWWTCGDCLAAELAADEQRAIKHTLEIRERHAQGHGLPMCPAKRFSAEVIESEVQDWSNRNYGVRHERERDGTWIVWGEM